ncbi:MAG: hypothetical protein M9927_21180 [Anaerolineae bacterium]|nr:hypothetical protein [Anaerolineae bacterium]
MFTALAAVMMTVVAPATSPAPTFGPDYNVKVKAADGVQPFVFGMLRAKAKAAADVQTLVFDAGIKAKGGNKK